MCHPTPLLARLRADLAALNELPLSVEVPAFLLGERGCALTRVHPAAILLACVEDLLAGSPHAARVGAPEFVYGLYVPTFAGLDGRLGTLLTVLPFLRFVHNTLGADSIMLLPITESGRVNRKGRRGSPFATRDPFAIDARFGDPLLPRWTSHDLYVCVTEVAAGAGLRLGSVLPLATLSIDSPLLGVMPDLTYWWHASPSERLALGTDATDPAIAPVDRDRFADPPDPAEVTPFAVDGGEFFVTRNASGKPMLTPANAVPDVVPAMNATYTWEDVVSLNYTTLAHPVCHADHRLAPQRRDRSAWRLIPEVIAWHLRHGERVLQVDVLSSVPAEVIANGVKLAMSAQPLKTAPACCDAIRQPLAAAPWIVGEELWSFGAPDVIDAVVGPFIYCAAPYAREPARLVESLEHHVRLLTATRSAKRFFAGVATHDTIPPDPIAARPLMLFLWLLPGSVPFIFSGTEHGVDNICNREFGFTRAEQESLSYEDLELFSPKPLDWQDVDATSSLHSQVALIGFLRAARAATLDCLDLGQVASVWQPGNSEGRASATGFVTRTTTGRAVAVAANFSRSNTLTRVRRPRACSAARTLAWVGEAAPVIAVDGTLTLPPNCAVAWLPAPLLLQGPPVSCAGRWVLPR